MKRNPTLLPEAILIQNQRVSNPAAMDLRAREIPAMAGATASIPVRINKIKAVRANSNPVSTALSQAAARVTVVSRTSRGKATISMGNLILINRVHNMAIKVHNMDNKVRSTDNKVKVRSMDNKARNMDSRDHIKVNLDLNSGNKVLNMASQVLNTDSHSLVRSTGSQASTATSMASKTTIRIQRAGIL